MPEPKIGAVLFKEGNVVNETGVVDRLIELAVAQGFVFEDDIHSMLVGRRHDFDTIVKRLEDHGVRIVEDNSRSGQREARSSSSRTYDSFTLYMKEAGRVPLLDREQEVELSKQIESGRQARKEVAENRISSTEAKRRIRRGEAARRHMIAANLRLVISAAKRYMRRGIPMADLVQEGNLGLIRAIKKFDYKRGYKFSTYATWWIRQAISRGVNNNARTIRIPIHMINRMSRLRRAHRRLVQKYGRDPTDEELAQALNMEPKDVGKLKEYSRRPLSLEAPLQEDGDGALEDIIPEEDPRPLLQDHYDRQLKLKLQQVLEQFPPREAKVISLRFGLKDGQPHSLAAIGRKLGITRERTRQLEAEYLEKLQDPAIKQMMREVLPE